MKIKNLKKIILLSSLLFACYLEFAHADSVDVEIDTWRWRNDDQGQVRVVEKSTGKTVFSETLSGQQKYRFIYSFDGSTSGVLILYSTECMPVEYGTLSSIVNELDPNFCRKFN